MPESDHYCTQHGRFDERLKGLERGQDVTFRKVDAVYDKMDGIKAWLMGIAGGLIVALVLLVINLLAKGIGQ